MKYILLETTKFILQEAEETMASLTAELDTLTDKINSPAYTTDLDTVAKAEEAVNVEDIEKAKAEVEKVTAADGGDTNIIKTAVNEYLDEVSKLIPTEALAAYPELATMRADLQKAVNQYAEEGKDEIERTFDLFSVAITRIIEKNSSRGLGDTAAKTVTDLENLRNIIIDNRTEFLADAEKDIKNYTKIIKDLDKKLPETLLSTDEETSEADKIITLEDTSTAIQQLIKDLDTIKKAVTTKNQAELTNWDEEFKNSIDKDAFFKKYFEQEWGPNANIIKGLGKSFYNEVENAGFNKKSNPFIAFLKLADDNKFITKLNRDNYAEIHNARVYGRLTDADLRGTGDFRMYNVIFNPNFYSQSAADELDFLTEQNKLRQNWTKLNDTAKQLYINKDTRPILLGNIMLANGDTDNFNASVNNTSQLRLVTDVHNIIAGLLNDEATTELDNDTAKNAASEFDGNVKQAIKFIINSFSLQYPKELQKFNNTQYNIFDPTKDTTLDFNTGIAIGQQLGLFNKVVSFDTIEVLLSELASQDPDFKKIAPDTTK